MVLPVSLRAAETLQVLMHEDVAGHLLRTREVTLHQDGRVMEETYDFITGPTHQVRYLPSLSKAVLKQLATDLQQSGFFELPSRVPRRDRIIPDAPFQRLEIILGSREHVVTWDPSEEGASEADVASFTKAWKALTKVLRLSPLRSLEAGESIMIEPLPQGKPLPKSATSALEPPSAQASDTLALTFTAWAEAAQLKTLGASTHLRKLARLGVHARET
jgi:hypothetical protein